jgi:hypothetical protein
MVRADGLRFIKNRIPFVARMPTCCGRCNDAPDAEMTPKRCIGVTSEPWGDVRRATELYPREGMILAGLGPYPRYQITPS